MAQQHTQTRLMEAIAMERRRLASRRTFLTGAGKVTAGGALALAALPTGPRSVLAQDFADDLEILNYALTLEHLEAFFYTEGLTRFEAGDFSDDRSIRGNSADDEDETGGASIYARLEAVRDHEQAHVETLRQTIADLDGTPVEAGEYDFGDAFDGAQAFLETARALENTGIAAYLGAAPRISDPDILAAAASILVIEARHASYVDSLVGESPFPEAFAEPLSRDTVLDTAGGFIVGEGAGADTTETPEDTEATEEPGATEAPEETETEETEDELELPPTPTPTPTP